MTTVKLVATLMVIPVSILAVTVNHAMKVRVRDAFTISRDSAAVTLSASEPDPSLPPVAGATGCGGSAKFEDLRYAGCVSTYNGTCLVPGDGQKKPVQFAFSTPPNFPAVTQISVKIRASVWIFSDTIIDMPVDNSAVDGGNLYILSAEVQVDDDLAGNTVSVQALIYDTYQPNQVLVCAKANMRIVNP